MKLLAFSFSDEGAKIGKKLEESLDYNIGHLTSRELEVRVSEYLEDKWDSLDGVVFIGAMGIAVRIIAPLILHKTSDPAVVVIDDLGENSISVLSGHLGGANQLAEELADYLGARPIITTASDKRGIEALDLFAKKNNYEMEDMKTITRLTRKMVDGKKIAWFSEEKELIDYPHLKIFTSLEDMRADGEIEGAILVTSSLIGQKEMGSLPYTILRPKNLNIGIGCRKGVEADRIKAAIGDLFQELKLSQASIGKIGTVEIKKDEAGIIETADYYGVDMTIFSLEEIGRVDHKFKGSDFVKKTIGVYAVAEPSAYLLGGKIISKRTSHEGITLSVTKEDMNG